MCIKKDLGVQIWLKHFLDKSCMTALQKTQSEADCPIYWLSHCCGLCTGWTSKCFCKLPLKKSQFTLTQIMALNQSRKT